MSFSLMQSLRRVKESLKDGAELRKGKEGAIVGEQAMSNSFSHRFSVSLFLCLSVSQSLCLSVSQSVFLSLFLSLCLFVSVSLSLRAQHKKLCFI